MEKYIQIRRKKATPTSSKTASQLLNVVIQYTQNVIFITICNPIHSNCHLYYILYSNTLKLSSLLHFVIEYTYIFIFITFRDPINLKYHLSHVLELNTLKLSCLIRFGIQYIKLSSSLHCAIHKS